MTLRFRDFEVDPQQRELRCAGHVLPVQGRTLDLLLYLLQHRDRVVGREELLDEVWLAAQPV